MLRNQSIDFAYVGPNPAWGNSSLTTAADFGGKIAATSRLGNTQDLVARAWLKFGGLKVTKTGGDATVLPTANPDQLLRAVGAVAGDWRSPRCLLSILR